MQRQFTSGSRQAPDPFDQFLEEHNYYRKHTARDASCLFRVISEQMYDTQLHHLVIRKKCVNYMRKHRQFFQPLVDKDLDEYLDDMSKPKTYGTLVELQAVGYMFERNVLLFQPFDLGNYFNSRSYFNQVFRVFYTPERHFDTVFTCDYIKDAAICQSICYEILYKDLYKLPDVSFAVEQMLHSTTFEGTDCSSETNKDGYCTGIKLSDGRSFEFDLPNNTCCILENYKLCHFHYTNFPRLSDDLQREMKNSTNRGDEQDKNALNKAAESLLPNKFTSCVRQLLQEGITPFPYKVAKALDPNMYRNIEFDSWNEARKEMKMQHWYNGDTNFKVGAKCHVKLRKSENDLYTCHIQEIAVDKRYCVVFIEQLGEKRLVPYDSLTPLPPDEFKPWTIPYRLQRHMQKYSSFRYTRHYNYRFKFNGQFSAHEYCAALPTIKSELYDIDDNPKEQYAISSQYGQPHHNNCYYKLKQYTHLENFRTQTVEYCTMPLTVDHSNEQKTQRCTPNMNENSSRAPSRSSVTTGDGGQSKQDYYDDAAQLHNDGIMEQCEMEHNGYIPEMHCFYPVHPYGGGPDDYFSYGYDGSLHPATLLPANAGGGTVYYTCGPGYPPPNNFYVQAPPPLPQPSVLSSSAAVGSTGHTGATYYHPNPYYTSGGILPTTVPQQTHANTAVINQQSVTPSSSTRGGRAANNGAVTPLNGRINWEAKKSMKSNGIDLPTDVATLRYFYNLGLEYHNKQLKQNTAEGSTDCKDNNVKLAADKMKNMNLDENSNQNDTKYDTNNNLTSNAVSHSNTNPSQNPNFTINKVTHQQKRFNSRYFNSKERQAYQRNNNTVVNTTSGQNTRSNNNNNVHQNDKNQTCGKNATANNSPSNTMSGVTNSRNQNNNSSTNAANTGNNVVAVSSEQGNQASPIQPCEVNNGADVMQNPTTIYNPNTNPFITYGEYNGDQNGQCPQFGPAPPPPAGGVFIQMPIAPSPYGIYTAPPPPPPTAIGIPHVAGAYSPYIGPPPPIGGGNTVAIPSPLQGPHQPPPLQAANGFYATTPNGAEPNESNGFTDAGGMHYQCMNYPPPVSFYYTPNATNIAGGGSNTNTPPNTHQSVAGGVAGPLPSSVCQQGYWCLPPPPPPANMSPVTQTSQSNGVPPATGGGNCNNGPNTLIQSTTANAITTQNRREKQNLNE